MSHPGEIYDWVGVLVSSNLKKIELRLRFFYSEEQLLFRDFFNYWFFKIVIGSAKVTLAWIPVPQDSTTKWCQQLLFPTNRKLDICHCSARGSCSAVDVLRNLNGIAIDGINGCRGNLHATGSRQLCIVSIPRHI